MKRALPLVFLAACGRSTSPEVPKPGTDPSQQQQRPLRGCEGRAVISLDDERTVTRLSAAGSKALFTFGADLSDKDVYVMQWNVRGDRAAGVAFLDASAPHRYEYVLLDTDGSVVFHRVRLEPSNPVFYLGGDGSLAVESEVSSFIVGHDGAVTELGELTPMGPVLGGGTVVVARGKAWEATSEKGLWKDGTFTPLEPSLDSAYALHALETRAVYVAQGQLISVPDGRKVALPKTDLGIVRTDGDRWVLLVDSTSTVVVDLELGTASTLAAVPQAERWSQWTVSPGPDGSVLTGVMRGDQLQPQRTADLGESWSDFGEPMQLGNDFGLGRWLFALEHAGTVLAMSMSTGYGNFVNEVEVISTLGAHRLPIQSIFVNGDLSPGAADLSADGQCAAVVVRGDGETVLGPHSNLVFMDAQGKQTAVHSADQIGWLRFAP
jgi:hypothetical protein